jgi:hypothetical protein
LRPARDVNTEDFYAELAVVDSFDGVCSLSNYAELPADWHVVVADVRDSTGAIRAGLYKGVNILGVSVITAVLNVARPLAIPYLFGGDGACLCIPQRIVPAARAALMAVGAMARQEFGLHLRIGIVPVSDLARSGRPVLVARHRVSRHYVQTAFAGGGVELAESLIKSPQSAAAYCLPESGGDSGPDLSGLECRWDEVPSRHGETIALIVSARTAGMDDAIRFYNAVIGQIHEVYGNDEQCRPVHVGGLQTTYNPEKLRFETAVRTHGRKRIARLRYLLTILVQNVIGWVLMTFKLHTADVAWGDYRPDLVRNTDFKKFDGALRAVLSGTAQQREALHAWLETRYRAGKCVYGIHASRGAIVTCLISSRAGAHFHFVDGAEGGYAMAAAGMKQQIRSLAAP